MVSNVSNVSNVSDKTMNTVIKITLIFFAAYFLYRYFFLGMDNNGGDASIVNYSMVPLEKDAKAEPAQLPINTKAQNFVDQLAQVDLSEDLLSTGTNINLNTIPTSRKNPNLQLRSEPQLSETTTGPWNNSTIVPTYTPRPLGL